MKPSPLQGRPEPRANAAISRPSAGPVPRVGIIGAGGFGARHAKTLDLLAGEGLCRLVAACDPQLESLPEIWRTESLRHVHLFSDHEQMLGAGDYDYIVIASPPQWHEEHCLRALRTGAFIYLEKPPVPSFVQLRNLLQQPGAHRVAVGFQMLESPAIRALKRRLVTGALGEVREIWACGLWPRATSYYNRSPWAGKMTHEGRPVFDGPLTNALAHLVQNVFFLAGTGMRECAVPATAAGTLARAQAIESYDFGWIKGTMENGVAYNILAAHCGRDFLPWRVSIRTDRGTYSLNESDVSSGDDSLLVESHRAYLQETPEPSRVTCGLAECLGYSMATSTAWLSALSITEIPRAEVLVEGRGPDAVHHVESVSRLARNLQTGPQAAHTMPEWLKWGRELDCQEVLAMTAEAPGATPQEAEKGDFVCANGTGETAEALKINTTAA